MLLAVRSGQVPVTGLGPALSCAGLALAVASERMIERARTVPERGAYFDVVAYQERVNLMRDVLRGSL